MVPASCGGFAKFWFLPTFWFLVGFCFRYTLSVISVAFFVPFCLHPCCIFLLLPTSCFRSLIFIFFLHLVSSSLILFPPVSLSNQVLSFVLVIPSYSTCALFLFLILEEGPDTSFCYLCSIVLNICFKVFSWIFSGLADAKIKKFLKDLLIYNNVPVKQSSDDPMQSEFCFVFCYLCRFFQNGPLDLSPTFRVTTNNLDLRGFKKARDIWNCFQNLALMIFSNYYHATFWECFFKEEFITWGL